MKVNSYLFLPSNLKPDHDFRVLGRVERDGRDREVHSSLASHTLSHAACERVWHARLRGREVRTEGRRMGGWVVG